MATLSLTWEYLLVINMDLYHITRASSELGLLCRPSSSHSYSPHRSALLKIVLESTTGNHQLGMAAVPCLWYSRSVTWKGASVYIHHSSLFRHLAQRGPFLRHAVWVYLWVGSLQRGMIAYPTPWVMFFMTIPRGSRGDQVFLSNSFLLW